MNYKACETITIRFSDDGKCIGIFTEQGKAPVTMERGNPEGSRPFLDHIGAVLGLTLWAEAVREAVNENTDKGD